jgi:hypothetical protein
MVTMKARYSGKCYACLADISVGEIVIWYKARGAKSGTVKHERCDDAQQRRDEDQQGQGQEQEKPAPQDQPQEQPPGMSRDDVRAIAIEEDQRHTLEQLSQVMTAVDERIRKQAPVELHVCQGTNAVPKSTKNAHKELSALFYLISKRLHGTCTWPGPRAEVRARVRCRQRRRWAWSTATRP